MSDKLRKSGNIAGAVQSLNDRLRDYNVLQPVAVLPDFTESGTLPVGTTTIIGNSRPLNPSLVGMDIGCGYQLFTMDINPKRFYKKGKFKYDSAKEFIDKLSGEIHKPKKKADKYLGTIGKGNHFVNMYVTEENYNEDLLQEIGLKPKSVSFLIHTGSRLKGFETHKKFSELFAKNELSPEEFNQKYLTAFAETREYAVQNRTELRRIISEFLNDYPVQLVFDKTHNDIETYDDESYKIRKGTSSLQPGELFIIPSNAADVAYLVRGREGLADTYYTINHGCGRKYTRTQMFNRLRKTNFEYMFKSVALNVSYKQMIEEAPVGYKDIQDVLASLEEFKISENIAKLKPVGVVVER